MSDRPLAPRPSPRPDAQEFENPDPDSPVTGVHPATRDFVRTVNKSGLWTVGYVIGGFAVAAFLAGAFATRAIAQEAHDAGVNAAKEHESRIKALEDQVPQLRKEVFDARVDMRDLYKAVVEKKRSERLEQPPPNLDGGK